MKRLQSLIFFICCVYLQAQEIPPLKSYLPQDYVADGQNWDISQDSIGSIFFANNAGLLKFDGAKWQLNPTPNGSVMRSAEAIGDRIYVGFYMGFGYYQSNEFGILSYYSLSDQVKTEILEDEDFWQIEKFKHWVLFRSLNKIYFYNTLNNSFHSYLSKNTINCLAIFDESVYYHVANEGIYSLVEGEAKLLFSDDRLKNMKLVQIFRSKDGIIGISERKGIIKISGENADFFNDGLQSTLIGKTVYSAIQLNSQKIALGTISDGLLITDENGALEFQINQEKGLSNNTVLSLFQDAQNTLWLGTQNGTDYVNVNSSLKFYTDRKGKIGTIYDAILFENNLYLGTNQGLFYRQANDKSDDFKLINGTSGQVWNLEVIQGDLFCGHDSGTFIIKNERATKISDGSGTWLIREIPNNQDILLQGTYNGIHVLAKTNGSWQYRNKIEGFDYSSQFFEIENEKVLINHEFRGVYELILSDDLSSFSNVKRIETFEVNQASGLSRYKDRIYYAGQQGFYTYETDKGFVRVEKMSNDISEGFVSGRMSINSDGVWMFADNALVNLKRGILNQALEFNRIPFPTAPLSSSLRGFQKLSKIDDTNYLIGYTNGYVLADINNLEQQDFEVTINQVLNYRSNGALNGPLEIRGDQEFEHQSNGFHMYYSVPYFDAMRQVEYQTQLLGRSDEWTEWTTLPEVNYENLKHGDYEFKVRAKIGNKISNNTASFGFSIDKPWYITNLMLAIYALMIILFSIFMHHVYKRYYTKEKLKLIEKNKKELQLAKIQNEKEIIKIKNEQLRTDVQNKSKELAASTMNLVKKNELLTTIKNQLTKVENQKAIIPVLKVINENLDSEGNWELFKEAFNNVDRKFMKKLNKTHPNLSPNDIKLCAYLRLNLSSKEIAPLFNISSRSVEIKRYRLRKKLNLMREDNLVNYILDL